MRRVRDAIALVHVGEREADTDADENKTGSFLDKGWSWFSASSSSCNSKATTKPTSSEKKYGNASSDEEEEDDDDAASGDESGNGKGGNTNLDDGKNGNSNGNEGSGKSGNSNANAKQKQLSERAEKKQQVREKRELLKLLRYEEVRKHHKKYLAITVAVDDEAAIWNLFWNQRVMDVLSNVDETFLGIRTKRKNSSVLGIRRSS